VFFGDEVHDDDFSPVFIFRSSCRWRSGVRGEAVVGVLVLFGLVSLFDDFLHERRARHVMRKQ
jgi:hypothetical protein